MLYQTYLQDVRLLLLFQVLLDSNPVSYTHLDVYKRQDYLLSPSVREWLPQAHLARSVVDVIEGLDLSALERAYAGRGSDAYPPAMLLGLLIYGYATGGFSSRKVERATYDSLVFRFIACNCHSDHDTLATFRQRFAEEFQSVFVQVMQVARENQLSKFGTVSLAGTKIHAKASRHSALSQGHIEKIEAQLKAEVQEPVSYTHLDVYKRQR